MKNREERDFVRHYAMTLRRSSSVPERERRASHDWLTKRGLPSGYKGVKSGVGIAVMPRNEDRIDAALARRNSMVAIVEECYARGRTDPEYILSQFKRL